MSEISILGFKPDSESPDTDIIHWAILISPLTTNRSEPQKHKARFFSPRSSKTSMSQDDESQLFDMHDHRLRQQTYPVPIVRDESPSTSTSPSPSVPTTVVASNTTNRIFSLTETLDSSTSSLPATNDATPTTTSITSVTNQTLPLYLRIKLGTHHSSPHKAAQKLYSVLYCTPTYGPEDDWLRAALDTLLGSGLLEPSTNINIGVPLESYDASRVHDFAREAAKEAIILSESQHRPQPRLDPQDYNDPDSELNPVLEMDYPAHLARIAGVKALFRPHSHSFSRRSTRSSSSLHSSAPSTPRSLSQTHLQVVEPDVHPQQPQPQLEPRPLPQPASLADEPPPAYTPSNPPSPTLTSSVPVPTPAASTAISTGTATATSTGTRTTPTPLEARATGVRKSKNHATAFLSGHYKSFLGLRISQSPNACRQHNSTRPAQERWSFERQDDPYAGLM
ncbi:hypothetical protein A1O3_08846 [Capronia epimyces CBS 606.96]|uniref:Uncharacterized protein n=1 Tax=Capronia epimyces CBS 606.96 TaxID=1182542 RepID=W9YAG3_9EURO|nr:uncharacterized protein A1O3_08846 [Capronia epimyces CBS 606.96]EXJ79344.1 hypothetical protein A1O3_08846 [Capronia epimyces CBS 606.96]